MLLGADPLADFPDADLARRALAGAPRIIAVDTFLTDVEPAGRRRAAGGRLRREGAARTTNLEGRVTHGRQKVTPRGTARAGLDDRRRARRCCSAPTSASDAVDEVTDEIAATVAGLRRRSPPRRSAATADGVVLAACPRGRPLAADRAPRPPTATATTSASWSAASCTTQASARRTSPSLAAAGPRRRRPRAPARPRPPRRRRRRRRQGHPAARHASCCRSSPTTACPAASAWVPFNQPGGDVGELDRRHRAGHRRPDRDALMLRRSTRSSIGDLDLGDVLIVLLKVRRRLRRRPRRRRCSWSGSSARSSPACRTASARTRPARSASCRRSPTASSCSSRKTCIPEQRRPLRVPAGAVPGVRAGVPRVVGHPARRRLHRRQRRHRRRCSATTPGCSWPTRRSACCCCWPCQLDRRLRHHARRLVVGLEVPAARLGAGLGADGLATRPRSASASPPCCSSSGTLSAPAASSSRRTASRNWNSSPPASCRSSSS